MSDSFDIERVLPQVTMLDRVQGLREKGADVQRKAVGDQRQRRKKRFVHPGDIQDASDIGGEEIAAVSETSEGGAVQDVPDSKTVPGDSESPHRPIDITV